MFLFLVWLMVLLHGMTLWACSNSCPSSCMCTEEKSCMVLCDHTNMAEVPTEFPCEATSINLEKNHLKFLSERAFGALPALKSLFLDHNNISFITPGAFKGLSNLQELTMGHNQYIRYLHTRTFTSLRRLVRLDLSGCNLFSIPDRIFLEQTSLKELICFQNNFRRIPGAIRGMANLTRVYLERNKIEAVAYNSLLGLCNLKYLNLQENRIGVLHDDAFKDLGELQIFYLNDNLLVDLPRKSFKGLGRLKMLNLGGNLLTNVSNTWFGDLVELEVLYLDRNCLSFIDQGAFDNLTSLMTLHLNSNKLTTLPFPVFQPIYFISHLYLFRNPWNCSCELEWLKVWMVNYKLVRDVPCASPPTVVGLDLSKVLFTHINSTCIDPVAFTWNTAGPDHSTTLSRGNSLITKLTNQEVREEMRNETVMKPAEVQLSAAHRSSGVDSVLLPLLLIIQVQTGGWFDRSDL